MLHRWSVTVLIEASSRGLAEEAVARGRDAMLAVLTSDPEAEPPRLRAAVRHLTVSPLHTEPAS